MSKYNKNFERDFKWYMSMRHIFSFDGSSSYHNKRGEYIVQYDKKGASGKEAFFQYDSNGTIKPTKHPNLLLSLLKTKGSANLHIKMYAEDLAKCRWNKIEMRALCIKYKAPDWFRKAVDNQRWKLVFKEDNMM